MTFIEDHDITAAQTRKLIEETLFVWLDRNYTKEEMIAKVRNWWAEYGSGPDFIEKPLLL